jgi:hypothetical protein
MTHPTITFETNSEDSVHARVDIPERSTGNAEPSDIYALTVYALFDGGFLDQFVMAFTSCLEGEETPREAFQRLMKDTPN